MSRSNFKPAAAPAEQPAPEKFQQWAVADEQERKEHPRRAGEPKRIPAEPIVAAGEEGVDLYPRGGERVQEWAGFNMPHPKVPDMPVQSVTGAKQTGQSVSFTGAMPFPPPPAPRKPFRVK